MNLTSISSTSLLISFICYCIAFMVFVIAITGKKWTTDNPEGHGQRWSRSAFAVSVVGLGLHLIYFFTRWYSAGHIPTSNMFEFMTFLSMMISAAFIVVFLIYRTPVIGVFAMPVGIIILAYASVFPHDIQPLIPSLQSYWLKIHVTTAATGEAFFAVGFAGGLMYLIRTVNYRATDETSRKEQRGLEFIILFVLLIIGFILAVFTFKGIGYGAQFQQEIITINQEGVTSSRIETVDYVLPPIIQPYNSVQISMDSFLGATSPLLEAPYWMKGVNAGRKLNTVIWSILMGSLLYGLVRLLIRKPIGQAIAPIMEGMDAEDLDEISYRAIAIGFPIFTLGALIFAMIWAAEAWGRFWGWDPKEVWALITWLFYAAYLHLRLSRGWLGKKSAWMTVIGFLIVMFTLIGVNLVIAGLHSYAGV